MKPLRVALINLSPVYGDVEANVAAIQHHCYRLIEENVGLVCFPEMCLTGYSTCPEILDHSQSLNDRPIQALTSLAAETGMAVVVGFPEWDASVRRTYITQVCCMPDGKVFHYRKTHLTAREKKVFTAGEALGVFQDATNKFGMQLCYDAHFPELSLAQALAGAQVILVCSASPMGDANGLRERWLRYLPARAYDNGCYVLTCNQHGPLPSGKSCAGLAMAFDPHGMLIAESGSADTPCIVDLDLGCVEDARRKRPFLRLRRPSIYRISKSMDASE